MATGITHSLSRPITTVMIHFRIGICSCALSEDSSNGAGNAGFRYSQASSNGGDLRFITKAGRGIEVRNCQLEHCGRISGLGTGAQPQSDENVTMYWGNANAGLPAYANNGSTWDDYFGVYHLEGTAGTATRLQPVKQRSTRSQCSCNGSLGSLRSLLLFHLCSKQWFSRQYIFAHQRQGGNLYHLGKHTK